MLTSMQQHVKSAVVRHQVGIGGIDQTRHLLSALVDATQGQTGTIIDTERVHRVAVAVVEVHQLVMALATLDSSGCDEGVVSLAEVRLNLDAGQQQVQHCLDLGPHHVAVLLHRHLIDHDQLVLLLHDILHRNGACVVHALRQ